MFTSIPQIIERFGSILEATLNSKTGRMFTGSAGNIDLGVSNMDEVFPSLAGTSCTACFVCRFPELRLAKHTADTADTADTATTH